MEKSVGEVIVKEINSTLGSFINNRNSLSIEELEYIEENIKSYLEFVQETLHERKEKDTLSKEVKLIRSIKTNMVFLSSPISEDSLRNEDGSFNISKFIDNLEISRNVLACIGEYESISGNSNYFKYEKEYLKKYIYRIWKYIV